MATAKFRGRKYKVWFTTEIPSNLFPWKLKGLPGAILKFEDDEGLFSGEATAVKLNYSAKFPKKVLGIFYENAKINAIKIKDFIIIDNKYLQEMQNEELASYPIGLKIKPVYIRSGRLEKSFEWEITK